jgi:hypothetical protein
MYVCMYDLGSTEGRRSIADCLTGIPLLGECRRAEVEGLCVCVCVCVCVCCACVFVHVFACRVGRERGVAREGCVKMIKQTYTLKS